MITSHCTKSYCIYKCKLFTKQICKVLYMKGYTNVEKGVINLVKPIEKFDFVTGWFSLMSITLQWLRQDKGNQT